MERQPSRRRSNPGVATIFLPPISGVRLLFIFSDGLKSVISHETNAMSRVSFIFIYAPVETLVGPRQTIIYLARAELVLGVDPDETSMCITL